MTDDRMLRLGVTAARADRRARLGTLSDQDRFLNIMRDSARHVVSRKAACKPDIKAFASGYLAGLDDDTTEDARNG